MDVTLSTVIKYYCKVLRMTKKKLQKVSGLELKNVLKHFLDKEVDESYYLKDETIRSLNLHKERHEAQGNGFGWKPSNGGVSLTQLKPKADIDQTVTLLLSNQGKAIEKVGTEVANTIMARDYKGFGNQAMNAVLEKTGGGGRNNP